VCYLLTGKATERGQDRCGNTESLHCSAGIQSFAASSDPSFLYPLRLTNPKHWDDQYPINRRIGGNDEEW
jgi:hypothetical protein